MIWSRLLRRATAAFGIAAAAASCTSAAAPSASAFSTPKPAMWQVKDADTTIYLFGTIHLLPDNYQWRTPRIEQAVASANDLVVETIIDPENPAPLIAAMTRLGMSPGLPPITERVPAEKRQALATAIQSSGIPIAVFNRLETWAAAFNLLGIQFRSLGLETDDGVEHSLKASFRAAGKPVGQLETNAEQLSFFDQLPEASQRELLVSALDDPRNAKTQFDGMLASWVRGDVDAIARTFNSEMAESPDLRDMLLTRRNANWAGWVERRMSQPGTVLVAVGAGHLAGQDSVQQLLAKRGLKVTRVQ